MTGRGELGLCGIFRGTFGSKLGQQGIHAMSMATMLVVPSLDGPGRGVDRYLVDLLTESEPCQTFEATVDRSRLLI